MHKQSSILYKGKHLHSIRAPKREAERIIISQLEKSGFFDRIAGDKSPKIFIINSPHTFASLIIRGYYPNCEIYFIYTDSSLYNAITQLPLHNSHAKDQFLLIDNIRKASQFFLEQLQGLAIFLLQIIDWFPSSIVQMHKAIIAEFYTSMQQAKGELLTCLHFGKYWHRNIAKNIRSVQSNRRITRISGVVILCASGPSLTNAIPLLRRYAKEVSVWALPSSIRALESAGVAIDCIVTSDAGYWAGRHLKFASADTHLLYALSSFIPASILKQFNSKEFFAYTMPILQMADECNSDQISMSNKYFHWFPERGSVLFTALDFLEKLQPDTVILLGADFSHNNFQSHVRPHTFDELLESGGNRLKPQSTLHFERGSGNQLSLYANWFQQADFSRMPKLYSWGCGAENKRVHAIESRSEFESLLDKPAPKSIQWEKVEYPKFNLFRKVPKPLPSDLFSNQAYSDLREILLYYDGLALKAAFLQWLEGAEESEAVLGYEKVLNETLWEPSY